MSVVLLRTLTRKSKLGFGKHKNMTVQQFLDENKPIKLISPYYKLTTINFTEDILDELNISPEWRVNKPGSNEDLYYKFLKEVGYDKKKRSSGADILKKYSKPPSRGKLQTKNHGK
tara:strand:- start:9 stop:356 length:348 start_codon:yes stop_codon:yes gene_type:complete